jgi:hypothetical protein
MLQIPGLEMFIISRQVADIEAAASRERLAAEARKWHAARVARVREPLVEQPTLATRVVTRLAGGRA